MSLFGSPADACSSLRETNYVQLTVSTIIVIGMLISYLPQHYRIVARGTSEGISPWFVLLGTTSATSAFANVLTVPPSRRDIACCYEVETFECIAGLLGIVQLGVQWLCFALILVLFLIFFRYDDATVPEEELRGRQPPWQTAVLVGSLCLFHGLIVMIVTGVFLIAVPDHLTFWANLLGVMAASLAAVQYIPQIWTTYHLKHVGSLSIPMMLIQTPGGLLFAASLFGRLGIEGWSTWGIFLLTAFMQGTLLTMGIYYELQLRKNDSESQDETGDESTDAGTDAGTNGDSSRRRAYRPRGPSRQYSEGLADGLPGPYTAHPERYADTQDEFDMLLAREDRQVEREREPLLRPGGIGSSARNYEGVQRSNRD